jgi:hypothetical protein
VRVHVSTVLKKLRVRDQGERAQVAARRVRTWGQAGGTPLGRYSVTWMVLPHRDCEPSMKVPPSSVVWKT